MIKEWVDSWWPKNRRGEKASLWNLARPKFVLRAALITALYFQGMAATALPEGKQIHRSTYTEEPSFLSEIVLGSEDHDRLYKAMNDYEEETRQLLEAYTPGNTRWEVDFFPMKHTPDIGWGVYDNTLWDLECPPDPIRNIGGDYSGHYFMRNAGHDGKDRYYVKSRRGAFLEGIMVETPINRPDSIERVVALHLPDEFYEQYPEWKFAEGTDMFGDEMDPKVKEQAKRFTKETYERLNIEEIVETLPPFTPPPKTEYPPIPFEAVVFNLPLLADRKKKHTSEIVLEQRTEELSREEQDKAKGSIYEQYLDGKDVFNAPAASLFATPALVKKYKDHIETENYQKGFLDPQGRAFNRLGNVWFGYRKDLQPEEYTFVGLGSGDGKQDINMLRQLSAWSRIKSYISIDDETNIMRAGGEIADRFEVPVDGATIDLEKDRQGLENYLRSTKEEHKRPFVYATQDMDINWVDPLAMYQTLANVMDQEDVLIRAGPLEHEDMRQTYDGIEDAAKAYLQHLGLDPSAWRFDGARYDQPSQEFQTTFVCEKEDLLPYNGYQMVFRPGVQLRHLTSRRKDLKPDLEKLGLKHVKRFDGEGYAIDFYRKK